MNEIILIGNNDKPYLTNGWYDLEKSPEGIYYRASKKIAELSIPIMGTLTLSLMLSARPEHVGDPLRITMIVSNDQKHKFTLPSNCWTIRNFEFQLEKGDTIQIRTQNPWSPDAIYKNGDARALGILLSSMRWWTRS